MTVPCKVDTGCNDIMPSNIFQKQFHSTTKDTLAATKDTATFRTYNSTTITQLGRYGVVIENTNKSFLWFQGTEMHY